jgi:Zn-dependent M28 family amino/carboxypeptidase
VKNSHLALVVTAAVAATLTIAAAGDSGMSEKRMREHVRFLASDELGGRAPGSRGEELAVAYLTDELKKLGCGPGNPDGSFVQTVPLYGYTVTNAPTLAVHRTDGKERTFASGSEFVGWTLRQEPVSTVDDAEMVFVGYGVDAPEYNWNDYRDTDVRGKIVVILVNDPPLADESMFGGRAMTYYGRWTYKYEEAAAMGALGAVIVHNTEDAGYPWAVVENSWSGEQFDVVRPDRGAGRCALESWITEDAARELFAMTGRDFDAEKEAAASPGFRAVAMGLSGSARIECATRTLESHNVVARVEGSDPALRDEVILYTAHWDHLGIGKPADGDSIYNGALDNATGVAGVMEIAARFARDRKSLKRSAVFIFTTGEESGLLGATYYVENPLYPLESSVAEINVDGLNVWGRTRDMVVVGYGQSNLDQLLVEAIAPMDRTIAPDSEPEKGYYYRSDHFPFAKYGVPALYADSGVEFRDRPQGWGMERRREYVAQRYHKPQDEYSDSWDLSGAMEDMEALFRVGYALASTDKAVAWSEKSEFRRVREEMMRGSR